MLAASCSIAARCDFSLDELRYEYPEELVPTGETPASQLKKLTLAGMRQRWPDGVPAKVSKLVAHELQLINELQYEPYFLTVYDIVQFARAQNILCQGRGSAANSAVCYCLGITEVDPARMDMLFERFISKERNEPPDIDVDFEHERREEVIQYLYQKYGRDRAALAATVISYRPKSALRDVGKALGLSLEQVDRLAKAMAWWDGRQIAPQRLREAGFDPDNPHIQRVVALSHEILGFPRHLSQHVGGFVISRGPLSRLVPIENAAMAERTVIQWDKDDLDALGLLKVDCLGLGMLTAIHRAFDLITQTRGQPMSMRAVPAEDPAVYTMIQAADTMGVFQIESRAQMAMLPRLRPANFYDLVIEVAIVRPGPIQGDMVHPYLRRRQGLEPVTYPNAAVREVLARTLGVPIFQEQVIKLAMVAAGFSPGEADQLRRSMAAWRRNGNLDHFEQRLKGGMRERGYSAEFAERIFQQIQGFGEYGFPESHSASFALLVYVSAWLKYYEPAAFTCALLNSQPMGFYAAAQLIQDLQRHGVAVRPVAVNISDWDCTLEKEKGDSPLFADKTRGAVPASGNIAQQPALRLGLRMIKGLSKVGAKRLVTAQRQAAFTSLDDLARRTRLKPRDLEALAAADALAGLAGNRHQSSWTVAGLEPAMPLFVREQVTDAARIEHAQPMAAQGGGRSPRKGDSPLFVDEKKGTVPFSVPFSEADGVLGHNQIPEAIPLLRPPTEGENIVHDYSHLGLTLRRHPVALLRPRLRQMGLLSAEEVFKITHGEKVRTAGLVICRQCPSSASGVIFMTLEDETGMLQVIVWPSLMEKQRRVLLGARLMEVAGEVQREGEVLHVIADRLRDHTPLLGKLLIRSRDFH